MSINKDKEFNEKGSLTYLNFHDSKITFLGIKFIPISNLWGTTKVKNIHFSFLFPLLFPNIIEINIFFLLLFLLPFALLFFFLPLSSFNCNKKKLKKKTM